jgi:putative transposase
LFSNRIVGYSLGDHMTADLATSALRSAVAPRAGRHRGSAFGQGFATPIPGLSGRAQGQPPHRVDWPGDFGGRQRAMESFFSLLQSNVLDQRRSRSRGGLSFEIVTWIERTYNRRRRQRGFGNLTPVEFELAFSDREDLAA